MKLIFSLFLFFLGGCAHYHSGIGPNLAFHSIYVAPIRNSSFFAEISGPLTAEVRNIFSSKFGLALKSKSSADAELAIEITDFSQEASAYSDSDTSKSISIDLEITVKCTLKNISTGEVYFEDQKVMASLDMEKTGDFALSREQAIPELMRILAVKIGALIENIW